MKTLIALTLLIAVRLSAATVTSPLTATATVGIAFSYQITASGPATGYAATGLPAGLTYVATTGLVAGVPTTAGAYTVTLAANLTDGEFTSAKLALTVNAGSVTPPVTPPPATTLFCATDTNPACGVVLKWTTPAPPTAPTLAVTGFRVYRAVGSGVASQITTTAITGTTYTDKTIAPSTTYAYYVVSVDAAGTQSAPSNTLSVVVAAAPSVPTPATPTGLTGSVVN